jgi:hypothetical protein
MKKFFLLAIVILVLALAAWFYLPTLIERQGILAQFPVPSELTMESQTYLSAIIPDEWKSIEELEPRYELSFSYSFENRSACRNGSRTYQRKQVTVNLRLTDLRNSSLVAEESFIGAEPASCGDIGLATDDIYGTLPALGILENWLLTALEGNDNLPALELAERAGMSLLGTDPALHRRLRTDFPALSFVPINKRPAYLLLAYQSYNTNEQCEYGLFGSTTTVLRRLRVNISFQLIDMQTGEILFTDEIAGANVPPCPATLELAGDDQRDLLGEAPSREDIENWYASVFLEAYPELAN